jgi:hypothetical protein
MAQIDLFRMPKRPWNSGRIIGAKPPLKPKHVWGIRPRAVGTDRDVISEPSLGGRWLSAKQTL